MSFLAGLKDVAAKLKVIPKSLSDMDVVLLGDSTLEKLQNLYDQRRYV
jgi:hypothetical protein